MTENMALYFPFPSRKVQIDLESIPMKILEFKSEATRTKRSFLLSWLACLLFFLLSFNGPLQAGSTYNLSYHLKGSTHGRILLIIPFRVYYESFATVNMVSEKSLNGADEFYFAGIPEFGYMMRTSGFSGRTLVILTAGNDLGEALIFSRKKLEQIGIISPYYARFVRRKKPFLFKIFPNDKNDIRFKRSRSGLHSGAFCHLKVRFQYYPEILNIDFNIYHILLEMTKAYNHPFVPDSNIEGIKRNPAMVWKSPPLDFSASINRIVRLAARVMKRLKRFEQARSFRLLYRVVSMSDSKLVISGKASPNVPIWGDYVISKISRTVILKSKGSDLIEDSLTMKIEDPDGKGLEAKVSLRQID
jgi:hypothetical protein